MACSTGANFTNICNLYLELVCNGGGNVGGCQGAFQTGLSLLLEDFIISPLLVPECDSVPCFEEDVLTQHLYMQLCCLFFCHLPRLPLGEYRLGNPSVWVGMSVRVCACTHAYMYTPVVCLKKLDVSLRRVRDYPGLRICWSQENGP